MSRIFDAINLYSVHFSEFIKWRTKIFTIEIFCFFTSKKAKMRLKHSIKCVLCTERMQFHCVRVKDGLKSFDREICWLIIRHEPAGQPRSIRIKLRFYWTKIPIQRLETLLMIFRSHIQVFSTIFIKLVMSVDSTLGYRTPWPRPKWRVGPRSAIRWLDAKKIIHFWNPW